jgi:hypothetical protein
LNRKRSALGAATVGRTIRFLNSALCPQISFATPTLSRHYCMRTNMSYPPEKDSIVVETPPRGGMLGALQSSFRVIQGHLGMKAPKKRHTSPPSYEAVLLQKNSEGNSRIKQLNVYEFLKKLGPTLPPITARSERGVEFKRIYCNRHSNFAPLRRREDEDDRRGIDENAQFPNLPEIRQELECNPWA